MVPQSWLVLLVGLTAMHGGAEGRPGACIPHTYHIKGRGMFRSSHTKGMEREHEMMLHSVPVSHASCPYCLLKVSFEMGGARAVSQYPLYVLRGEVHCHEKDPLCKEKKHWYRAHEGMSADRDEGNRRRVRVLEEKDGLVHHVHATERVEHRDVPGEHVHEAEATMRLVSVGTALMSSEGEEEGCAIPSGYHVAYDDLLDHHEPPTLEVLAEAVLANRVTEIIGNLTRHPALLQEYLALEPSPVKRVAVLTAALGCAPCRQYVSDCIANKCGVSSLDDFLVSVHFPDAAMGRALVALWEREGAPAASAPALGEALSSVREEDRDILVKGVVGAYPSIEWVHFYGNAGSTTSWAVLERWAGEGFADDILLAWRKEPRAHTNYTHLIKSQPGTRTARAAMHALSLHHSFHATDLDCSLLEHVSDERMVEEIALRHRCRAAGTTGIEWHIGKRFFKEYTLGGGAARAAVGVSSGYRGGLSYPPMSFAGVWYVGADARGWAYASVLGKQYTFLSIDAQYSRSGSIGWDGRKNGGGNDEGEKSPPLRGSIVKVDGFGVRTAYGGEAGEYTYRCNTGIDLTSRNGSKEVLAVMGGKVVDSRVVGEQYAVLVLHGEYCVVYSGLQHPTTLSRVEAGDVLGKLAGDVLHFEVWKKERCTRTSSSSAMASARRWLLGFVPPQCSGHVVVKKGDSGAHLTHAEAVDLLGDGVEFAGEGTSRCKQGDVSLEKVRKHAALMLKDMLATAGCEGTTVTGGTELYKQLGEGEACAQAAEQGAVGTTVNVTAGEWDCLSMWLRRTQKDRTVQTVLTATEGCMYRVRVLSYEACLSHDGEEWSLTALDPESECPRACHKEGEGCRQHCNTACCAFDHGKCAKDDEVPDAVIEEWPGRDAQSNCLIDPVSRLQMPKGLEDVRQLLNHVDIGDDTSGSDTNLLRVVVLNNVRIQRPLLGKPKGKGEHEMHTLNIPMRLEASGALVKAEKPLFPPYSVSYAVLFFLATMRVSAFAVYGLDWMAALDISQRQLEAGLRPYAGLQVDVDGFVDIYLVRGGVTLRGEVGGAVPFKGVLKLGQWPAKLCLDAQLEISGGLSFLAWYQIRDKFECRWKKVLFIRIPLCWLYWGGRKEREIFAVSYGKVVPLLNTCQSGRGGVPVVMTRVRVGEWNTVRYTADTLLPLYWDTVPQGDCPSSPTYRHRLVYHNGATPWSLPSMLTSASPAVPPLPEGTRVVAEVQVETCEGSVATGRSHEVLFNAMPPTVTVNRGFVRGEDLPYTSISGMVCCWTEVESVGPVRWSRMAVIDEKDAVVGEGYIGDRGCVTADTVQGARYTIEVEVTSQSGLVGTARSAALVVDTSTPGMLRANSTCDPRASGRVQASTGRWCVEVELESTPSGVVSLSAGLGKGPYGVDVMPLHPLEHLGSNRYRGMVEASLPRDIRLHPMIVGTTGGGLAFTHSLPTFIDTNTPPSIGDFMVAGDGCQRAEEPVCSTYRAMPGRYGEVQSEWRVRTPSASSNWTAVDGRSCVPQSLRGADTVWGELRVTDEVGLVSRRLTRKAVVDHSPPTCGTVALSGCGGTKHTASIWGDAGMLCIALSGFSDTGCGLSHINVALRGGAGEEEWNVTKVEGETRLLVMPELDDGGEYVLTATAVDKALRTCTADPLDFTVSASPPMFPVLSLAGGPVSRKREHRVVARAVDLVGLKEVEVGVCIQGMMVVGHRFHLNGEKEWSGNLTLAVPMQDGDTLQACARGVNKVGHVGLEYSERTTLFDSSPPVPGEVMVVGKPGGGTHLTHVSGSGFVVAIERFFGSDAQPARSGERRAVEGKYALHPEMYLVSTTPSQPRCSPGMQAALLSEGTEAADTVVATACLPTGPVLRRLSNSDKVGSVPTAFGGSWVVGQGDAVSPLFATAPLDDFCVVDPGTGVTCTVRTCLAGEPFADITPRHCLVVRDGPTPPYLSENPEATEIAASATWIGKGLGRPGADIATPECTKAGTCGSVFRTDVYLTGRQAKREGNRHGFHDPHSPVECSAQINRGEWVPFPPGSNFLNYTFDPPLSGAVAVRAKCCNLAGMCVEQQSPMTMVAEVPTFDVVASDGTFSNTHSISVEWEVRGVSDVVSVEYCVTQAGSPCTLYKAIPMTGSYTHHDNRLLTGVPLVQCLRVVANSTAPLAACASPVVIDTTPPTLLLTADCGCGNGCPYLSGETCQVHVAGDDPESDVSLTVLAGNATVGPLTSGAHTIVVPAALLIAAEGKNGAGLVARVEVTLRYREEPRVTMQVDPICIDRNTQVAPCFSVSTDSSGVCEGKIIGRLVEDFEVPSRVIKGRVCIDPARFDEVILREIEVAEGSNLIATPVSLAIHARSCASQLTRVLRTALVAPQGPKSTCPLTVPRVEVQRSLDLDPTYHCPTIEAPQCYPHTITRVCVAGQCDFTEKKGVDGSSWCVKVDGVPSGEYALEVVAEDCFGQLSTAKGKVLVDRLPPVPGDTVLCEGEVAGLCLELRGFADDSQLPLRFDVAVPSQPLITTNETRVFLPSPLRPGDVVTVTATDQSGKSAASSMTFRPAKQVASPEGFEVDGVLFPGDDVCLRWTSSGNHRVTISQNGSVVFSGEYTAPPCIALPELEVGAVVFELVRTAEGSVSAPRVAFSTVKTGLDVHGVRIDPLLAIAPLREISLLVAAGGTDLVEVHAWIGQTVVFNDTVVPNHPTTLPMQPLLLEGGYMLRINVSRGTHRQIGFEATVTVVSPEGPDISVDMVGGTAHRRAVVLSGASGAVHTSQSKVLEMRVGVKGGVSAVWCLGLGHGVCDVAGPWPVPSTGVVSTVSVAHMISDGVVHFVSITACNSGGACSTQSQMMVGDSTPPEPPTAVVPAWNNGTANVTWHGADDPHTGVKHHELCLAKTLEACVATWNQVGDAWEVVQGMEDKERYLVCVRSVNGVGGVSSPVCGLTVVDQGEPKVQHAEISFNGTGHESSWKLNGTLVMHWEWDTAAPMDVQWVGVKGEGDTAARGWVEVAGESRLHVYEGWFPNATRWILCVRGRNEAGGEGEGCTPPTDIRITANSTHSNYTDPTAPRFTTPLSLSPCLPNLTIPECLITSNTTEVFISCEDAESGVAAVTLCVEGVEEMCTDLPEGHTSLAVQTALMREGRARVTAVCVNFAGNSTTSEVVAVVERSPPTITTFSPPGHLRSGIQHCIAVEVVDPESGMKAVWLEVVQHASEDVVWTVDVRNGRACTTFAEGWYTLTAWGENWKGMTTTRSSPVVADASPPTVIGPNTLQLQGGGECLPSMHAIVLCHPTYVDPESGVREVCYHSESLGVHHCSPQKCIDFKKLSLPQPGKGIEVTFHAVNRAGMRSADGNFSCTVGRDGTPAPRPRVITPIASCSDMVCTVSFNGPTSAALQTTYGVVFTADGAIPPFPSPPFPVSGVEEVEVYVASQGAGLLLSFTDDGVLPASTSVDLGRESQQYNTFVTLKVPQELRTLRAIMEGIARDAACDVADVVLLNAQFINDHLFVDVTVVTDTLPSLQRILTRWSGLLTLPRPPPVPVPAPLSTPPPALHPTPSPTFSPSAPPQTLSPPPLDRPTTHPSPTLPTQSPTRPPPRASTAESGIPIWPIALAGGVVAAMVLVGAMWRVGWARRGKETVVEAIKVVPLPPPLDMAPLPPAPVSPLATSRSAETTPSMACESAPEQLPPIPGVPLNPID